MAAAAAAGGLTEIKLKAARQLLDELGPDVDLEPGDGARDLIAEKVRDILSRLLAGYGAPLSRMERDDLVQQVVDEVLELGPISPLVRDPLITEVMVNGPHSVYVERDGRIQRNPAAFRDNAHLLHVVERILSPLGRRVDEASPMVDARLPDGSRVNVIIPPVAVHGPTVTIRKFGARPLTAADLVGLGTWSPPMAQFLRACVEGRRNVLVSGGAGTGKTTTLNVLSSFIPDGERIITIEDAAELRLQQEHVVALEARPANIEGRGRVDIRALVINALRMRPDRLVVGEVRGGEALDMLQAMNTGHEGSMSTVHANNPRDVITRLETMVLMAGVELPIRAVREQIRSGVDLIVHLARLRDGRRLVTHVTEVVGLEGDTLTLQDIFVFRQEGVDDQGRALGKFTATGVIPTFCDALRIRGVSLPQELFDIRGAGE